MLNSQSDKPKILYIVTQAEWGGAQRHVFDLASRLSEDFEINVAAGTDGDSQELFERLKDYKIERLTFKHLVREINPYHDLLAVLEIAKLYKKLKPDIVHLNSSKAGVLGSLAIWLKRSLDFAHSLRSFAPLGMTKKGLQTASGKRQTKIIYTAHGWAYLEPLPFYKRWLYLIMEKLAAQLRDATIVLSEKEKEIALKHGTAKKKSVFVIPNGIDLDNLDFLEKEKSREILKILNIRYFVIGTIANLYKTKGLNYLIEAINLISKEQRTKNKEQVMNDNEQRAKSNINNIKLIIIGEGPERRNLGLRIKNYGLSDKVILTGSIPDASKYLKTFDIFVLPSVKEGFPYTILEAMAAGLPIVATDVGAIPEILENQKSGLIVPPARPQELAEALKNLISDPQKAQELGKNAAEAVKQFALDKMIEQTRSVYQKISAI